MIFAELSIESIINGGAAGVLGMVVIWLITKTLPNLIADFRTDMQRTHTDCAAERKERLAEFRGELAENRENWRACTDQLTRAVDKLSESVRAK